MPSQKSSFLDKVLGRINRLDSEGLQTVVERLARERSFLETLFDTIEDGVLVVDENGKILYFNQAVTRLLGLSEPGVEGQQISRYLPDLEWDKLLEMDFKGGRRVSRHEIEVDYPQTRLLSLYVSPLDGEATGSSGLALIIHDATEAREKTFAAIESERIQALTLLSASVAHEIGNPLNALHIHLQLMERELRKLKRSSQQTVAPASESRPSGRGHRKTTPVASDTDDILHKLEKYLDVSKGEITRLDYIITQFLQAIRPAVPQLNQVSLNDVVKETVALLRPEIENRGLRLDENLDSSLPVVPIDPGQMKQALVNLMKNALHAMTKEGILTLATGFNAEAIWVSVADTGGGIPQEKLNRIFEPFFTTKKKGSGLGLLIVQRIVREHGGRIELESHVNRGTTFRLWFPLQERRPRLLKEADGESDNVTEAETRPGD